MALKNLANSNATLGVTTDSIGVPGQPVKIPFLLTSIKADGLPVLVNQLNYLPLQCALKTYNFFIAIENIASLDPAPEQPNDGYYDGSIYSNNGSQFKIIRYTYLEIDDKPATGDKTYNIRLVTRRIFGTNEPLYHSTLTKVSGAGETTFIYDITYFNFSCTDVTVWPKVGDTYSVNSSTYTIASIHENPLDSTKGTLVTDRTIGTNDPPVSGTLAKVTGNIFSFDCSGMTNSPKESDIYSNNSSQFTVTKITPSGAGSATLTVEKTSGVNDPLASGILHRESPFTFDAFGVTFLPSVGDIYSNNSSQFTITKVTDNGSGSVTIATTRSTGTNYPTSPSTLIRISGAGDASINYTHTVGDEDIIFVLGTPGEPTITYIQGNDYPASFVSGSGTILTTAINDIIDDVKPIREDDTSICRGLFTSEQGMNIICKCNVYIDDPGQTTDKWE